MFICQQCGACCSQLYYFTDEYNHLDRGDGICKYFDTKNMLCTQYKARPKICSVKNSYALYSNQFSYEEYCNLMVQGCTQLRKAKFLNEVTSNQLNNLDGVIQMFVQNLNANQQAFFLTLANMVALADGQLLPEEKGRIESFKSQMPGVSPKQCDIRGLSDSFDTKISKSSTLIELAGLAMADGNIADEEHQILKDLSDEFSIDHGELDEMISWVSRAFYLFREVQNFLED